MPASGLSLTGDNVEATGTDPNVPIENPQILSSSSTTTTAAARTTTALVSPSSPPPTEFFLSDKIIRFIFLLLGIGILIPWNAFVSAAPYFSARLCGEGRHDIINFEKWFGLVWNSCSVLSLALIIAGQVMSDHRKKQLAAADTTMTSRVLLGGQGATSSNRIDPGDLEDDSSRGSNGSHNTGRSGGDNSAGIRSNHDHSFLLVMVPLMLYLSVFALQAGLVLVPQLPPEHFLSLTMVGLAVCGTCGAIATAGIVSTAGLFPSSLGINPFFEGQAVGGVLVSVANLATAVFQDPTDFWDQHCTASNITDSVSENLPISMTRGWTTATKQISRMELDIYSSPPTDLPISLEEDGATCSPYAVLDWAVFIYFCAGCVVLLLCLLGYHHIHKYQQVRHRDDYEVIHDALHPVPSPGNPGESEAIEVPATDVPFDASPRTGLELYDRTSDRESYARGGKAITSGSVDDSNHIVVNSHVDRTIVNEGIFRDDLDDDHASIDEAYTDEVDEAAVFTAIKGPAACIFLVFTVTLALFPSFTSELASNRQCRTHFRLHNDLYVPFSFVFFNIGDLVGRMLAEKVPVQRIRHLSRKLVIFGTLRSLFLPVFLLCKTNLNSVHASNFVVPSDIFSSVVLFTFAVTNGLLVSTAFMHAPHLIAQTTELQERASEMMTFAVYFGLLSGSFLAFPFMELVTKI